MRKTAPAPPRAAAPPSAPERTHAPGTGAAALLYLGLSILYFLPAFAPGRMIFGTDFLGGGYMFYEFISERLAAGELPKWVPYVFGGMPLAANPGSTYHPVHMLADLVLPTAKVLPMVFLVHFWLAGLGMYLLARELGTRRWVAFVAGVAFQFTGITMSWVYAGQDGRIMVATLAPLLFFFLHRGIRTGRVAPFAGAAAAVGGALLSFQIQNSYYLLLSGAIWAVFALVHLGVVRRPAALARAVALGLGAVAFGFVLASVNFLPFLDYIPESPRGQEGGRGYEFATSYSMPEGELLSLAVPEQHGASVGDPETGEALFPEYRGENPFKLHTEYVGAVVIVLLALGAYYSRRNAYWWFFLGLSAFAMTIALGGNTPLYRLYYELLPGTRQFRAPSLIFFVVSLSLVTMAALTLERIAALREAARERRAGDAEAEERLGRLPWIAGGVVVLAVLGAMAASGEAAAGAPTPAEGWMRFALFAALAGGVLWWWTAGRIATTAAAVMLALVALTDLWVVDRRFFHTVEGPDELFAADDVVTFLRGQPGTFRVWTFPYPRHYRGAGSYGGNYPMLFDLEQAGGEHPNPLARWVEYVGPGERTYIDWHNFITEGEVVETPEGQALAFRSAPGFLDAANIRYVVSTAPLIHPGFREVYRGSALVYENTQALPRAYLVPRAVEVPEEGMIEAMRSPGWDPRRLAVVPAGAGVELPEAPLEGGAEVVEHAPDRVVVRTRADRAALLVLADNYYEGWVAEVDGRPAEIVPANNAFRGVVVPAGEHTVTFVYDPGDLYTGFYVTTAGLLLLAGYGVFLLLRRRRRDESPAPAG